MTASAPGLVVLGDALLDRDVDGAVERLSPDAPVPVLDERSLAARPGGAGLAAALAARDGLDVVLIAALARDAAGLELGALLADAGVEVIDLGLAGPTPEKVRFRSGARSLMRLDRGGRHGAPGPATPAARQALTQAATVLVSDYGRGMAAEPGLRPVLERVVPAVPVVWDPHPRGPAPVPGVLVATPNEAEVGRLAARPSGANDAAGDDGGSAGPDAGVATVADAAARLREQWLAGAVCVTRGAGGAVLVRGDGAPYAAPAPAVDAPDPCGAGDRFASALAVALAAGMPVEEAVTDAVGRASAFVAEGGAGAALAAAPMTQAGLDRVERVRAKGGTVVATGGCFDLLHAGHVRTLEAARRLGDALVVCLNSDASVRRLKGPDRPLVPQQDRAAVVAALGCVDAVVVFDEDTPEQVLARVRPHLWAKGGDYDGRELPEERVLRGWGGRAVILPYVEGRSTTRLIEEAACRG